MGAKEYIENDYFNSMLNNDCIKKEFAFIKNDTVLLVYYSKDNKYLSKCFILQDKFMQINEHICINAYYSLLKDYKEYIHQQKKHIANTLYKIGNYQQVCCSCTNSYKQLYNLIKVTLISILKINN